MSFLEVMNIYKDFGKTEVIKGISFSVEKGEVVSVIGSSGGGKTTLLRCLNLLEVPDRGSISVGGETVFDADEGKLSEKELRLRRLHFGLVFQQFNLFPQYNVFDNICLAPKLMAKSRPDYKENKAKIKAEIEGSALALLERIGLADKVKSYPSELSGGQQQRVAIARALALHPDILCFDEPTSALDPELTGEVLNVIKSLKNGDMTMIIVTHEMEFAKNVSDRIIYIADGIIEEQGSPEELFGNAQSEKTRLFLNRSLK